LQDLREIYHQLRRQHQASGFRSSKIVQDAPVCVGPSENRQGDVRVTGMTITQERKRILARLGQRLGAAWRVPEQIDTIADDEVPRNRPEAYFVQDEMAAAIDEPLTGWKVGATSARMRELDGHDDVIPGRIFHSVTWRGSRLTLPSARFPDARAETEFAFSINAPVSLRDSPWSIEELAPMATLHPAIEIIGNRHALPDASAPTRSLMTIADNGGGIGFVFGDPVADWQDIDFQQHHISLKVDDGAEAENFLGELRCVPIKAVADLVNQLQHRGIALNAGDFVSTGAATVPQHIQKGSSVIADFGILGRIELDFV
jgi:2-keto-4-pentenoate hydratase